MLEEELALDEATKSRNVIIESKMLEEELAIDETNEQAEQNPNDEATKTGNPINETSEASDIVSNYQPQNVIEYRKDAIKDADIWNRH